MLQIFTKKKNFFEIRKLISSMQLQGINMKQIFDKFVLQENYDDIKKIIDENFQENLRTHSSLVEKFYETKLNVVPNNFFENYEAALNNLERQFSMEVKDKMSCILSVFGLISSKKAVMFIESSTQGYEKISSVFFETSADENVLNKLVNFWRNDLIYAIQNDIITFKLSLELFKNKSIHPPQYFPFLALLSADVWVDILLHEVLPILLKQPNGLPVQHLCITIGRSARSKFVVFEGLRNGKVQKIKDSYKKFLSHILSSHSYHRVSWFNDASECLSLPSWDKSVYFSTVSFLLERLLSIARIPNFAKNKNSSKPAFEHVLMIKEDNSLEKLGIIRPTKFLYNLIKDNYIKEYDSFFHIPTDHLPMVVPPRPWTSCNSGGYVFTPTYIMRSKENSYQITLLRRSSEDLYSVYDALNYLSSCPWIINKKILDIVVRIFNSGGNESLGVPSYPYNSPSQKFGVGSKIMSEKYSLWMDMLYRLSLCHHFKDDVIWMPHNMDFRGRAYPIPPHVSHITMDIGRALLKFCNGHPLGDNGLNWLKIHLVNLHGLKKKESLKSRLAYADEVMDEVFDSASNPLKGNCWWASGDNPWQVLACCMEIRDALTSNDVKSFVSCLPVHQDGSCNGLQHYSALGRDALGAKKVNLCNTDKPEDTYAGVADMVEEKRKRDAMEGNQIAVRLDGLINRKVVKQTVMTIVYGVTRIGGRKQIEKQLKTYNIDEKHLWECSNYVTGLVFEALKEMFFNARSIQVEVDENEEVTKVNMLRKNAGFRHIIIEWLASSARQISMAKRPVQWVTPLGLPIVQPYYKPVSHRVKTSLQVFLYTKESSDNGSIPCTRKQKMAFPPNFVHSLDSTHMMLTALHCQMDGIPFVSIHDCFWTSACFVDRMNQICREEFVSLHSQPILQDLAEYWEKKYSHLKFKGNKGQVINCSFKDSIPSSGDFDLNEILTSTYFFN